MNNNAQLLFFQTEANGLLSSEPGTSKGAESPNTIYAFDHVMSAIIVTSFIKAS